VRIVILGAGQVGTSVAQSLVSEKNDITIVDTDRDRLERLQVRLDLRTVLGSAVLPSTLRDAGLEDADMLIALTNSDQTNLVACKLAYTVFNTPTRIARLRSLEFLNDPVLLTEANFAVNYVLCPEQVITDYLVKLVEFPEALQVLSFADGRVTLVAVRAYAGGLMVGKPIREMREHLGSNEDARIAAVFRRDHAVPPTGDTIIEDGDEVFVLAADEHIRRVMMEMRRMTTPVKRVIIAGGGNIGLRVAQRLEGKCTVKVIECDQERSRMIANRLGNGLVLLGDATDEELLQHEAIDETDLLLALTNDDEDNIMSASLAKKMGCKRVVALINRSAYVDLVQSGPIDIAFSPALVSIGDLLTHVRHGFVAKVHRLRHGAAEAIELVVHGDEKSSRVVGRRIGELPVIEGANIAAIVRNIDKTYRIPDSGGVLKSRKGSVLIAHKDIVIESGDHVIVFCLTNKVVKKAEKLFQVGLHFF
jgi:trk system potassium uptake protein TrkA